MTTKQDIKSVSNYQLKAANGRRIRVATKVEFNNGQVIRFVEKMSKRQAIENALYQTR